MSEFDNVVPEWDDIPEDDEAEAEDMGVEHEATPEEVEAVQEDEA